MNPASPDQPDLTAYALGELPPEQERDMRAWIAADPDAQVELTQIEQISDALHHGAPIPALKLTPQQRQNVLAPQKGPRILTPMMPRQPVVVRRQSRIAPFLVGVTKIAAVLAVAAGAYLLGRHASGPIAADIAKTEAPETNTAPKPVIAPVTPLRSTPLKKETPASPVAGVNEPASPESLPPASIEKAPQPAPVIADVNPAPTPEVKPLASAPQPADPKQPAAMVAAVTQAPKPAASTTAPAADNARGYTAVGRDPVARVIIRPYETRPVPVKVKGGVLASPMSPAAAALQPAAGGKARAPELAIQSWKAEVASCPWNPTHKLMRVLVQLPADQAASGSPANTYPLQVSFENLAVKSYRLLSENHVPPQPGTNAAAHVMWYEVIPNGTSGDSSRENGRQVATITVPNARFNSQTVGPFDSSKLQVLDRGVKWENAREDFLFETSIVGFGLLLRGEENLGSLDHELVLKLAEKAQGEKAADGERAKFIKLVREAKRVTGI